MKILIFAHTPPPHHGQSYMIQLMLEGFGGDRRKHSPVSPDSSHGIECYHVNARFSDGLQDVGSLRLGKGFQLLGFCLEAVWCRFRFGVKNFYYVPAPGKRSAVIRDWLVLLICRPFFSRIIFHWHAMGLAGWLEAAGQKRLRRLTHVLLKNADLSIVPTHLVRADAEQFSSRQIKVVPYGIPDPCPEFERDILPRRQACFAVRKKIIGGQNPDAEEIKSAGGDPQILKVLYLAHCIREKGLFDTLDGVAQANARLKSDQSSLEFRLVVAGEFVSAAERAEFERRIGRADLQSRAGKPSVEYLGFVTGADKYRAFAEADLFCFPTYYHAESFGLVVVEAMAFGLPVVTTRWRSLPEILPDGYAGLVDARAPEQVAAALVKLALTDDGTRLRRHFLENFTLTTHLARLAEAFRAVENPANRG